jgi:hypothetical protein
VQPIPNIIKVEPNNLDDSVEAEDPPTEQHEAAAPHTAVMGQGKTDTFADTLVKLISPKKKIGTRKKTPVEPTERLTRKQAKDTGATIPNVNTSTKELAKVEKPKTKTIKKK